MYFDYIYGLMIKRKFYLYELNVLENIKFKLIEEFIMLKYQYILKLIEDGFDFFFYFLINFIVQKNYMFIINMEQKQFVVEKK